MSFLYRLLLFFEKKVSKWRVLMGEKEEVVEKQRIIQEFVPGKQVTLAHIIANPQEGIYQKLGLVDQVNDAIGILTITPSEASIIAADVATKAAGIEIGFIDRFSGSLVITGDVASVESSVKEIMNILQNILDFTPAKITRT
jgi:ethanolamine utilization protein EutS